MKKIFSKIFLFTALFIVSCSTQKNTFLSRTYHNVTSKYNILFNGSESLKKGQLQISNSYKDNYLEILPIFHYEDKSVNDGSASDMDRSIKKAEKLISMHSITAKPEIKKNKTLSPKQKEMQNKKEFNKWVDNNYLMMGKAYFYKQDFDKAKEIFLFITNEYKDKKTTNEARIWLIRLYNITSQFENAEELIKILEAELKLSKRLKTELNSSIADFYLKQKDFTAAIPYLEKASNKASSKKLRIRYTFILAQLYEKTGDLKKASETYNEVIKMNPPYEMTFHSKINRALAYEQGIGSVKDIESQLLKMLKDDKNNDYQDQIYFALGNISLKEGEKDVAMARFKTSVEKNTGNTSQKVISYLTIANLYYADPDYVNAQAYYDSTVNLIDMSYPNYDVIFAKSKNLTSLVTEINTVNLEDSVQKLAQLPKNDILVRIDQIIQQIRDDEEKARQLEQEKMLDEQFALEMGLNNNPVNASNIGGSNQWYFYNETAKTVGYKEFRAKWGNRILEDNWRRKNKSMTFASVEEGETGDNELITNEQTESTGKKNNIYSRDYYLQNIPLTDSMMRNSHQKIESALLSMGLIYKNDLKDNKKAIDAFKELVNRYPSSENALRAYYNLYLIYKQENNSAMTELYKNKIITSFPESSYAHILTDPDYVKNLQAEENKIINYYSETYNIYNAGNYTEVIDRSNYAITNYPEDELIPKFTLLKTLSIGHTQDRKVFRDNLYEIVSKFPGTEVAENAKNIITYLDKENPDIKEEAELEIAKKLFEIEDAIHFFIFSVPKNLQTNQLIFNIINFNLDNFDDKNLRVENYDLNNNQKIIVIKQFTGKSEAMNYFNQINANNSLLFKDVSPEGITGFVIGEKNYSILQTDKSVERYMKFFNENYQN